MEHITAFTEERGKYKYATNGTEDVQYQKLWN
jgi:hypothetical protein